jgi:hypothetical protein
VKAGRIEDSRETVMEEMTRKLSKPSRKAQAGGKFLPNPDCRTGTEIGSGTALPAKAGCVFRGRKPAAVR